MSDANFWMSRALELESQQATQLTNFQKVQHFHNVFQQNAPKFMELDLTKAPTNIEITSRLILRDVLINEEADEVSDELLAQVPDINKIAKELADLLYVTYGCADMLGIPLDDVFEEVHQSNMSKLDDAGNPVFREDGKILKSKNYREADVKAVLDRFRRTEIPK
jgi:predicted HAD superfamily Cof-like phosphohydrolase